MFIGRTDTEAETPILWPPDVKNWLIGKDPDAQKDRGQEEKGTAEDEMAGWHHWLHGHESGWTPGVGDGQGGLACCNSWGRKESDTTEWLNWTECHLLIFAISMHSINKNFLRLLSILISIGEKENNVQEENNNICWIPSIGQPPGKPYLWKWKSCLTLCNPVDYTVHGILQARTLEWVAYPFSSGSSWPRNQTRVSRIAGGFFTNWAIREAPRKPKAHSK